uniref:Uncharacterized protein n=1 Tax=Candidatus Kentrum sp. TC TaxID=2126339 RepID=A0A451AD03_9GAMM|nr:MAG: hypothetical protein BECKTC1821F_GA0114240_11082 [Candidatus Kentron sp. TC]
MITTKIDSHLMKTPKIFESPLWKSAFFVYGLVAIGFSVLGFFMHSETEVPNIDELKTFTGIVSKVERWHIKNHSGYHLFLEFDGGIKKFDIRQCEYPLNLGIDSKQLILSGDAITIAVAGNLVWQVEKEGMLVCPYRRVVEIQTRFDQFEIKLSVFLLTFGLLLSTIGIIRTHRAARPSKA